MRVNYWLIESSVVSLQSFLLKGFTWAHPYLNRIETKVWSKSRCGMPFGYSLKKADQLANPLPGSGKQINHKRSTESPQQIDWETLTDKRYFSRHLPPSGRCDSEALEVSRIKELSELFIRENIGSAETPNEAMTKGRGNLVFMAFAQWLTDGVFRSDPKDRRKTSNLDHQIDLAQIYGSNHKDRDLLRTKRGGKLKLDKAGLPPRLFKENGQSDYKDLSYFEEINNVLQRNLVITTLLIREHNRICDELVKVYGASHYNDNELFGYARNILTVRLMQIIVRDYIGFLADKNYYRLDPSLSGKLKSRGEWMPVEFNLLYRWHSAVSKNLKLSQKKSIDWQIGVTELQSNSDFNKVVCALNAGSSGDITLGNTPGFLLEAEKAMISMDRAWKLRPYLEYYRAFDLPNLPKTFEELTGEKSLSSELDKLYNSDIEKLDFTVGLFAEKKYGSKLFGRNKLFGQLMLRMVAYDAFNHIYTNPLLSKNNYSANSFTKSGLGWLKKHASLDELIKTNIKQPKTSSLCPHYDLYPSDLMPLELSTSKNESLKQEQINSSICPVVRVGIKSNLILLDEDGWARTENVKDFLAKIGFKRKNILVSGITYLAQRLTGRRLIVGQTQLTKFKNTIQDHGSSTRILHDQKGFNKDRLNELLSFDRQNKGLGRKELATAVLFFHLNAEKHGGCKSFFGAIFELWEMGSLLRIFGADTDYGKRLSKDDIEALWVRSEAPKNFNWGKQPQTFTLTKSLIIGLIMIAHYLKAYIVNLYTKEYSPK